MAIDKFGGYTTTTYGYKPELDPALGRLESIAKQYAPGGQLAKTLTTAQESSLQKGKRKSMSNIAQQLVSAGLAGTTNLPSAELGYEAEVMAPARTQLDAEIAKMYIDAQMAIAQHIGQQQSQVNQMQYGAMQSAMRNVGQPRSTGFMESAAGGGGGGGYGDSLTGGLNYPGGGGGGGTAVGSGGYTPSPAYTGPTDTLLSPAGWEAAGGQPGKIASALRYAPGYGVGVGVAPVPTYSLLNEKGGAFRGAGFTGKW